MNPLHDYEAERTVLGCCFHNPRVAVEVTAQLSSDDFSLDAHRVVYAAIVELSARGQSVDDLSLGQQLGDKLAGIGGYAYIGDLTGGQVFRRDVSPQIARIREASRRRQLHETCNRGMLRCADPAEDTAGCFAAVGEDILQIQADTGTKWAERLGQFLPEVIGELQAQAKQDGLVGMTTGLDGLDFLTTGIRCGELWVIGALPGRGKTAIGAQIALANAASGTSCVVFSLEMTRGELARRFLTARCLSASKIRNPRYIGTEGWPTVIAAAQGLSDVPLWLDDSPSLTIQELLARARLYIRRHKARLLVVDYLRLVNAPGRELRERVGNVADALRQLAKTEQVGVVLLSQLRRPEGGINSRPSMIELKESGDIEAHAHVVLLLYIPVDDDGRPKGEDEIIIGKQRNGPIGSHPVVFSEQKLQFFDRVPGGRVMSAGGGA